MEGFYCDARTDAARIDLAEIMTASAVPTVSTILGIYGRGLDNYRSAVVVFEKTSVAGTKEVRATVERVPAGWRFVHVSDEN